jgi:hypothetical protein
VQWVQRVRVVHDGGGRARDLSDSGSKKASSCSAHQLLHSFASLCSPRLRHTHTHILSAETWNASQSTCNCLTVDCSSAIKHFTLRATKQASKRTDARAAPPDPPQRKQLSFSLSPRDSESCSPAAALCPKRQCRSVLVLFRSYYRAHSKAASSVSTRNIHFPLSPGPLIERRRLRDINKEGLIIALPIVFDARPPR